jgi:hypothetical protein
LAARGANGNFPGIGLLQAGNQPQQRAFAASASAYNGKKLAGLHN